MPTLDSAQFIGGCAVLFLCAVLAAAGGIGGGALNVPILLAVFGYDYKDAVTLSLCLVCGNVLSQFIVNFKKSHPLSTLRPIIYYDIAAILIPSQLGGNNVGALLVVILPPTLLMIIALFVILFAVYMTAMKGVHLYELESVVKQDSKSHGNNKSDFDSKISSSTITNPLAPTSSPYHESIILSNDQGDIIHGTGETGEDTVVVLEDEDGGASIGIEEGHRNSLHSQHSQHSQSLSHRISFSNTSTTAAAAPALVIDHVTEDAIHRQSFKTRPSLINTTFHTGSFDITQADTTDSDKNHTSVILPTKTIAIIIAVLIYFIIINTITSFYSKCSNIFWIIFSISYVILSVMMYTILEYIIHKQTSEEGNILLGDVNFSHDKFLRPIVAFIIGTYIYIYIYIYIYTLLLILYIMYI